MEIVGKWIEPPSFTHGLHEDVTQQHTTY